MGIELKLSTMKSLHAFWIIDVYNQTTSAAGRDVCFKDPFHDINPLDHDVTFMTDFHFITGSIHVIKRANTDDDDSDWEDDHGIQLPVNLSC